MNRVSSSPVKFDPFAEQQDHLRKLLESIAQLLGERRAARVEVIGCLVELAVHLRLHFEHEEQEDGFFEAILDQAPRLKGRADALMDEHDRLTASLDRLIWQARRRRSSNGWWTRLLADFEEFWRHLCRHEDSEEELVQQAFHLGLELEG